MRTLFLFVRLVLLVGLFSASSVYAQDNIILKNGTEIQAKVLEVSPGQIKYRRQDNPDGPIYTTGTADVLLIKYANGTKDILGQSATSIPGMSSAPTHPGLPGISNPTGTVLTGKLRYHHGLFSRYFTDGVGERIDPSTVRSLIANQPDAMQAYRRGQSLHRWTYITAGSAVALVGAGAMVALGDGSFGRMDNNRRDGVGTNTTTEPGKDVDHRGDHGRSAVGLALAGGGVVLGVAAIVLDFRTTVQFRRAANRYNLHQQPTSLHVGPSQRGLGVGLTYRF